MKVVLGFVSGLMSLSILSMNLGDQDKQNYDTIKYAVFSQKDRTWQDVFNRKHPVPTQEALDVLLCECHEFRDMHVVAPEKSLFWNMKIKGNLAKEIWNWRKNK